MLSGLVLLLLLRITAAPSFYIRPLLLIGSYFQSIHSIGRQGLWGDTWFVSRTTLPPSLSFAWLPQYL